MENIADLQFLKKLMRVFLFAMSTLTIKIRELECGFNRNNQSRSLTWNGKIQVLSYLRNGCIQSRDLEVGV